MSNQGQRPARDAEFMSALTTEHFVLSTAAGLVVSEEASRATVYVMALSSSLVAMGFTVQSSAAFTPFAATVLPTVFLLGLFTFVRLVDTGLQTMQLRSGMSRIRRYYRTLTPDARAYIIDWGGQDDETADVMASIGVGQRRDRLIALFTIASMIAAINSVVAGAGVTLLGTAVLGEDRLSISMAVGLVTAIACMGACYIYQRRRYRVRLAEWNAIRERFPLPDGGSERS